MPAVILSLASGCATPGGQVGDPSFHPRVPNPAHRSDNGPVVAIDEAHNNFHIAKGRYAPFSRLLRADGYRVTATTAPFCAESLAGIDILVIANAIHESNVEDWTLPTPSAFTRSEIDVVVRWVRDGGSLLLIADHMPFGGSAADLAAAFGVQFRNGFTYASEPAPPGPTIFDTQNGMLRRHAIVRGRSETERVTSVATFTGQAFTATTPVRAVLTFRAKAYTLLPHQAGVFHDNTPRETAAGHMQGATLRHGRGRVAFFGEAAMFTAQLSGPQERPMGMNHPRAEQNVQFVLNVMHWLSGLLPE